MAHRRLHMPLPRWLARFNLHMTNRILVPLARIVPAFNSTDWIFAIKHDGFCAVAHVNAAPYNVT